MLFLLFIINLLSKFLENVSFILPSLFQFNLSDSNWTQECHYWTVTASNPSKPPTTGKVCVWVCVCGGTYLWHENPQSAVWCEKIKVVPVVF